MSHRRHAGRALASIVLLAVAAAASAGPAGAVTRTITEFTIKTANNQPGDMTVGADGNIWFVDQATDKIGRVTKTGAISGFLIPTAASDPVGIATGSDGAVWFTEAAGNKIGRISSGGAFSQFSLGVTKTSPRGITAGPDGDLYFVEFTPHTVNKIDPHTHAVSLVAALPAGSGPTRITSGPDGNLWVSETSANKVVRVTPLGATLPVALTPKAAPARITSGNDGNVWVAEPGTNHVAQISTAGTVLHDFAVGGKPTGIASAPDGNLYVTEQTGNNMARVSTAGVVKAFAIPTKGSLPGGIVAGGDGNVWFSENHGDKIGRLAVAQGHSSWVIVHDGAFVPATQGIALATGTAKKPTTVRWMFETGASHNITDSSGMGLFGSPGPSMAPGTNYPFQFTTAGRFAYGSTVGSDTQQGVITVTPKAVVNGTNIDVTVATLYPSGVTTNVQVKLPGASGFTTPAGGNGVNTNTYVFNPAGVHGTYRFQVQTASGANTSGFSPTVTVVF